MTFIVEFKRLKSFFDAWITKFIFLRKMIQNLYKQIFKKNFHRDKSISFNLSLTHREKD